jgi:hypothetical protein
VAVVMMTMVKVRTKTKRAAHSVAQYEHVHLRSSKEQEASGVQFNTTHICLSAARSFFSCWSSSACLSSTDEREMVKEQKWAERSRGGVIIRVVIAVNNDEESSTQRYSEFLLCFQVKS